MRLFKHLFLIFSLYLILANSLPQQIFNGIHESHTPDIVITPKNQGEDDSVLLLRVGAAQYKKDSIEDVEVADLVSHLLSTQPLSQNSRSALPSVDPFDKPQANLLITIEGAGEDTVDPQTVEGAQKLKLKKSASPFEIASFLETISTGATPDVHGVTARRASPLVDTTSASLLVNFADVLSQTSDGNSLSLSLSSSSLSASPLAPHDSEPHANSGLLSFNTSTMEVNGHGKCSSHFKQKKEQLVSLLAKLPYVSVLGNSFTISLPDTAPALFELNKEEDLMFAMEISLSELLAEKLEKAEDLKSLVNDEYPDSLAITYVSLRKLGHSKQEKRNVARAFLLKHVNNLIQRINTTYSDRLSSQVLLVGSHRSCPFVSLAQKLPSYIDKKQLPYVFTKDSEYEKVCRELTDALETTDYDVHCLHQHVSHLRKRQVEPVVSDNLLFFQSIFWGVIGWILAILLIVNAMASINGGKDSLLYRSSVQSRHPHAQ
jgi:hypothetical protein